MFCFRIQQIKCRHRRLESRCLSSVAQYFLSHQTETALAVSTFIAMSAAGRAVQLEIRTRSQVQSLREEQRRGDELRESKEVDTLRYDALKKDHDNIVIQQSRLKDNFVMRGIAGENTLQRVLDEAKQQKLIKDFNLQLEIAGNKRPDAVIEMNNGTTIVVDSKHPEPPNELLSGSMDNNGDDDFDRKKYKEKLQNHIRELSKKGYHSCIPDSLNLTIMLVPGEGYLQAAYDLNGVDDLGLHIYAAEQNILLVGPNGLRSILQLLSFQQKEEDQAAKLDDENVRQVLQNRLQPLWTNNVLPRMRKMTLDLDKVVNSINDLGDDISAFDEELRSKAVLDLDKVAKTKLPKKVSEPVIF
jgi:DNA anti-recombination protein RmuC